MNCEFRQSHIISTLFKTNPLFRETERVSILGQLAEKTAEHKNLALNCLKLIKLLKNNDEIESVRDIGVGLLKVFNTNNNDE